MKTVKFFLFFMFIALFASSQTQNNAVSKKQNSNEALTSPASSTFGLIGGFNFAKGSLAVSGSNISINLGSVTTFSFGTNYSYNFKNCSIQESFLLSGKGAEETGSGNSVSFNMYYLEIPVDFRYHLPIKNGFVFIGAGPYIGYNLGGKVRTNGISRKLVIGNSNNSDFKPLDFGANLIAGVQLKSGLMFQIGYDLGMQNIAPQSGTSYKNKVFSVSMGFTLK